MSRRAQVSRSSRCALALVASILLVVVILGGGSARADNVDTLVGQLESGSDYKVRLSAALSLAKLGDARPSAINAFIKALGGDSDKAVRGAAAVGLSKLVSGATDKRLRTQAVAALDRAARSDRDSLVKKQAQKALEAIRGGDSAAEVAAGGIYVDVGPMATKGSAPGEMREVMRRTTSKVFVRSARDMLLSWPGGGAPSKTQLAAKKTSAYHVDGTLTELGVKEKGAVAVVSCKISMLIATYPEKSLFGFLNGGASVQASSSPDEVELAKEDCVVAVVEDLVANKIIPTIKTRSGQ